MHLHGNAKTTPKSRAQLADQVVRLGQPIRQVARGFGVSDTTVRKWVKRWREEGPSGLMDRRSTPRVIPHQTPRRLERRIGQLRRKRWVAWQIARTLNMAISTVSAVLRRMGLGRLSALDPKPAPPVRYERALPGELLHVDTKKLARFRSVGHRITGERRYDNKGIGWEFAHVCVDDHTRLAYVEVLPDERKESCSAFLLRAVRWFRRQSIEPAVMTDNGPAYNSRPWLRHCEALDLRHLRTRPYTPRTNGKAERFIQSLIREWAYGAAYRSSDCRQAALQAWLRYYNADRPHRALGMCPPRQRLRLAREQRA